MSQRECKAFDADLSAFLDRELDERRSAEIERHLAECERCRARLDELREVAAGLAALPRQRAPEQLLAMMRREAERQTLLGPSRPGTRTRLVIMSGHLTAAAAVIVACVLVGWQVLTSPKPADEGTALVQAPPRDAARGPIGGVMEEPIVAMRTPAPTARDERGFTSDDSADRLGALGYTNEPGVAAELAEGAKKEVTDEVARTIIDAPTLRENKATLGGQYAWTRQTTPTLEVVVTPQSSAEWVQSYSGIVACLSVDSRVQNGVADTNYFQDNFGRTALYRYDESHGIPDEPIAIELDVPVAQVGQTIEMLQRSAVRHAARLYFPAWDNRVLNELASGGTADRPYAAGLQKLADKADHDETDAAPGFAQREIEPTAPADDMRADLRLKDGNEVAQAPPPEREEAPRGGGARGRRIAGQEPETTAPAGRSRGGVAGRMQPADRATAGEEKQVASAAPQPATSAGSEKSVASGELRRDPARSARRSEQTRRGVATTTAPQGGQGGDGFAEAGAGEPVIADAWRDADELAAGTPASQPGSDEIRLGVPLRPVDQLESGRVDLLDAEARERLKAARPSPQTAPAVDVVKLRITLLPPSAAPTTRPASRPSERP